MRAHVGLSLHPLRHRPKQPDLILSLQNHELGKSLCVSRVPAGARPAVPACPMFHQEHTLACDVVEHLGSVLAGSDSCDAEALLVLESCGSEL